MPPDLSVRCRRAEASACYTRREMLWLREAHGLAKTISICIPCYNSERYIRTTIESALAQTVPADEILISDDRSPDRSFEIVK